VHGEPDELLGEIGGALPAGNIEGNELTPLALALVELPGMLMGLPAFASSIKVFTCTSIKRVSQEQAKQFHIWASKQVI
jgi:hypothetical protein